MKIVIYGDYVFSVEVASGFLEIGCETDIIHPETAHELGQYIREAKPDIFMTLGTPSFYRQEMLNTIGKKTSPGTIYVHWDTDGVLWEALEMNLIRASGPDAVFTICPVMQERISKLGIPCYILLFASNAQMHHPVLADDEYAGKITFVGNWYRALAETMPEHLRHESMRILFKPLIEGGNEVHFYGANAADYPFRQVFGLDIPRNCFHGHVPYEHIHRIFSGCFINLVPQNYEHSIIKRAFEILGSGGFGLSYDTAAMRATFPEGNGFVYTSSPKETLEIVEYYRNEPEAYNRVRKNALIMAQKHTYRQRAETIVRELFPG